MLNQVQTNVANSQNGGPLTDNVVFTALSGFLLLSVQRFLKCAEVIGECWGGKFSSFLDHLAPNGVSFRFVY